MFGSETSPATFPHLGIAYLTAVLKQYHLRVKIYDDSLPSPPLDFQIKTFRPHLIGVTGYSYSSHYLYEIIQKIKKTTTIPIIIGGPHVSAIKGDILKQTTADFAMYGEAETSLITFTQEFRQPHPNFSKIPNLIWRQKTKIIVNPPVQFHPNLDLLPLPDYEAFNLRKYSCYQDKIIPIITSRGCPYSCNYCSVRLTMGQNFRPRSPQNVISEIKHWYSKGFRTFDINDDCFTLDIRRAEDICDLIIKEKLKIKIQLYNGTRVDRITPRLLKKLKQAGCIFIAYGCESGSQKILNIIGKNITLKQVKKAVSWTNRIGIKNAVNFIIGHQQETYQDALKTLRFAQKLPSDYVNFYNLVPYPGTAIFSWIENNAEFLIPKDKYLQNISYRDNQPIFETKDFTKKQRQVIIARGFNFYEKKLYKFRLGKTLGTLCFYLTRFPPLAIASRYLVYHSKLAMSVFQKITLKSKQ